MPTTAETELTLVSRRSPLAVRQCETVAAALRQTSGKPVRIITVSTRADEVLDRPLADIGGKALFVKGLQEVVLTGRADAAVHSLKDMPAEPTPGLTLAAVGFAEDERDAVITANAAFSGLQSLRHAARVGTSSPRRQALLARYFPHLQSVLMRGNLQTRLAKLQAGECDALLLAAAGLKRIGLEEHISEYLPPAQFIPAVGQGLLAVECAAERPAVCALLAAVGDAAQMRRALAERAFAAAMGGDCHTALGAQATESGDGGMTVRAFYAAPPGDFCAGFEGDFCAGFEGGFYAATATAATPEAAGRQAAEEILTRVS